MIRRQNYICLIITLCPFHSNIKDILPSASGRFVCLSKTLLMSQGKLLSFAKSTNSSTPKSTLMKSRNVYTLRAIVCSVF